MRLDMDDRELLQLQANTLFVLTDTGRIVRTNEPVHQPGPRLYLAGCASGNVVRVRHDVGEQTAQALERLAADELPLREAGITPVHLDEYLQILAAEAPVDQCEPGLMWAYPGRLDYESAAALVGSDTPEGDRLVARLSEQGMPEALVALGFLGVGDFWAPWCVALDGDEIASIAFAARLGPTCAETGVNTVPAFRGRGFAAAAAAGWASLPALRGRTLFYSTSRANVSSQRVTQRLGLRFIGTSLKIT